MSPRGYKGCVVVWNRIRNTRAHSLSVETIRNSRGIHLGDTGLVISQNVTELHVLINGRMEYFQTSEVDAL